MSRTEQRLTAERLDETQRPVVCGGVSVEPGDVLVGDRDGIVVVSEAELLALLPRAEEVRRAEAGVMERLGRGDPLLDMLNLAEHRAALQEGKPSRLRIQP
jgi:regulator of RNase E activity RraA